jgi:hypothetical protein
MEKPFEIQCSGAGILPQGVFMLVPSRFATTSGTNRLGFAPSVWVKRGPQAIMRQTMLLHVNATGMVNNCAGHGLNRTGTGYDSGK